ncbi:Permease of the drug/metabolite transporter (DMT) superfamily [Lentibacillus persicus]|uniref:Permease of the drug/metabolite transporter (DMT) superfamily n=1 Tax=Lentibacillus persicus TaxID=640948 RepID=A0A1I1X8X8_9BACI|nr:DMT family transporter [Lentibacillus persicus]SFE03802.1 Permease of the drug/metabolite transporter (DMT) superfamily [Lentibacillus persicus]
MLKAYIFMLFVVIFYAGNILTGRAINELPPFTIAFFRLLIAFIVMLPFGLRGAWQYRHTFFNYKKPLLIMTLTGITFFNTFIYGALQFTTSTNVSVLESVIPVATVILSAILLKERLRNTQIAGVLISFFGAVWVVLDGNMLSIAQMSWNIGDIIMIGAIVTWAVYSIWVKQYMHLFPQFGALVLMSGISVVVLLPFVLIEWYVTGVPSELTYAPNFIGLAYLGVFPSFIALIFYNHAVGVLGASQASIFLNFLPVVTMAGAYFWLGETITIMKIIGALLVIAGVILTTKTRKPRSAHKRVYSRTN